MEIFCKVRNRKIKVQDRLAHALVKMKRAEYLTEDVKPVQYEQKVMKPTEPVVEQPDTSTDTISKKDELKAVLDAFDIEYDGRSSEKKLQELVDNIGKD